jgi:lipopolysaccharide export system protein LptA
MCVKNSLCVLLSIAALCAAASAWALNSDKDQPINIQSDHGDFQSAASTDNGTGTYTGNVVITQGSIRITADKAVLHMANGEIQSADITGTPATFQQQPDSGPLSHGVANQITYDANNNQVVLTGNADVQQGERQIAGDLITYDTATEHVTATGGQTSGGRIHITLPPQHATAVPPAKAERNRRKHRKHEMTPPPSTTSHSPPA